MNPIAIFDGDCILCLHSMRFVYRQDATGALRFAAMQSEAGQALLRANGLPLADPESFYVVTDGLVLSRSAAIRFIAARLTWPWCLLRLAAAIPDPVLNRIYDMVVRNRHCITRRRPSCLVPPAADQWRFLQ